MTSSVGEKVKAGVSIVRPVNCVFGGTTVVIGVLGCKAYLPGTPQLLPLSILGWLTYFLMAAAGNVVNDVFDLEVDRVNKPARPLPSGRLSIGGAWAIFWVTLSAGVATSVVSGLLYSPLSWYVALFPAAFGYVGYWYARTGKVAGFPGNIVVGVSFSFGMLYGAWLCVPVPPAHLFLFFGTSFSLLVAREIVKGAEDVEGDAVRDVRTLALKLGKPRAVKVALGFQVAAVSFFTSALLVPTLSLPAKVALVPFIALGCGAVVASAVYSRRALGDTEHDTALFGRASLLLKAGAFVGLLAFLTSSAL
ncbi:MAG: geranylgeranylglycerol-phosphate geranylgeranyltransferase [Promethearchaeota archaeon]